MGRRNEILEFGFGLGVVFWLLQLLSHEGARADGDAVAVETFRWVCFLVRGETILTLLIGIECAVRWRDARLRTPLWFGVVQAENIVLFLFALGTGYLAWTHSPFLAILGCVVATLFVTDDARRMKIFTWMAVAIPVLFTFYLSWHSHLAFQRLGGDWAAASWFTDRWRVSRPEGSYDSVFRTAIVGWDVVRGLAAIALGTLMAPFIGFWLERGGLLQRGIRTRKRSRFLLGAGLVACIAFSILTELVPTTFRDSVWNVAGLGYGLALIGAAKSWGTGWMNNKIVDGLRAMGRSALSLGFFNSMVVLFIGAPFGLNRQGNLDPFTQLWVAAAMVFLNWVMAVGRKVGPFERLVQWVGGLMVPREVARQA